jgi:hypothetical protein
MLFAKIQVWPHTNMFIGSTDIKNLKSSFF